MKFPALMVALALAPSLVFAQEGAGPAWSVGGGKTTGTGANVIAGELGWPGLEGKYLHGMTDQMDLGARFAFLYGTPTGVNVWPAITFGGVLRAGLVRNGMVSLGVEFSPGIGFGFGSYGGGAGSFLVHFPFELQVGVHPAQMVNIVIAGRLMPTLDVGFNSAFSFGMPILFGPGVELALAHDLLVTLHTRFGPGVWASGGASGVVFSFVANFGIAYRL